MSGGKHRIGTASLLALVALATTALLLASLPSAAAPPQGTDVMVLFDSPGSVDPSAVAAHGRVTGSVDVAPVVFATVPAQAVPALEGVPGVVAVEPDSEVHLAKKPPWAGGGKGGGDDGGSSQPPQETPWGIMRIGAPDGAAAVDETGVDVAVLDTGIDHTHPDLDGNVELGVTTAGNGPVKEGLKFSSDKNGHGTHVAGTIAAEDNDIGVVGVAPAVDLWAVKVLGNDGSGSYSDVIQGIDWSVQNGAEVITMSLGGSVDSAALKAAVDSAHASGVVVVAAAGNSGDGDASTNDVEYPARYPSVIAVAATDSTDSTPVFSSEGPAVAVAAPGVSVKSTWLDGGYRVLDGTSMATPHVAGAAALLVAQNGSATPDQVRTGLTSTCLDIETFGVDNYSGHGLIRVLDALTGF